MEVTVWVSNPHRPTHMPTPTRTKASVRSGSAGGGDEFVSSRNAPVAQTSAHVKIIRHTQSLCPGPQKNGQSERK